MLFFNRNEMIHMETECGRSVDDELFVIAIVLQNCLDLSS